MDSFVWGDLGAACGRKHWSWLPCNLGVLISFWVVGCSGGDAVFFRVLLVFGGGVCGVESLFGGIRYICLAFLGAMAGQLFFLACGLCVVRILLGFFWTTCRLWDDDSVLKFLHGCAVCVLQSIGFW